MNRIYDVEGLVGCFDSVRDFGGLLEIKPNQNRVCGYLVIVYDREMHHLNMSIIE